MDFCNINETSLLAKRIKETPRDINIIPLYTYLCPIIIFICFFSITCNAILITISRRSKLVNKSPILLLSLNLAVTDLIASLLNGLSILFNSYLSEVHDRHLGQCSMLIFEVVRCAALVASALHLLALAFVHYRGIVAPLHYRSTVFFSQHLSRTINIISIACWIIPLTIMIALFSSTPCQGFQTADCDYLFLLGFRYRYAVLTLFAFPLLLMSVIYVRIFIIISRHQKSRRLNQKRSTMSSRTLGGSGLTGAGSVKLPELVGKRKGSFKNEAGDVSTAEEDVDDATTALNSARSTKCAHCRAKAFKRQDASEHSIPAGQRMIESCAQIQANEEQLAESLIGSPEERGQLAAGGYPLNGSEKPFAADSMLIVDSNIRDEPTPMKGERGSFVGKLVEADGCTCSCLAAETKSPLSSNLNGNGKQVKLSRANTIGESTEQVSKKRPCAGRSHVGKISTAISMLSNPNNQRGSFAANMTVSMASQRSSVSSTVEPVGHRAQLRRSPTSNSGSQITDYRSNQTFHLTSSQQDPNSSTYELQRRHLHASAVPQTNTKALVTTLLILGTYFISYVPAIAMQVLTCVDYCPYPLYEVSFSKRILFGSVTTFLLIGKSIIDPFIYSYRIGEIQVAVKRYISTRRSNHTSSMHVSTNQRLNASIYNNNNNNNHNNVQNFKETSYATSSFRILNNNNNNSANYNYRQNNLAIKREQFSLKENNSSRCPHKTPSMKAQKNLHTQLKGPEVAELIICKKEADNELLVDFNCDNSNGVRRRPEEERRELLMRNGDQSGERMSDVFDKVKRQHFQGGIPELSIEKDEEDGEEEEEERVGERMAASEKTALMVTMKPNSEEQEIYKTTSDTNGGGNFLIKSPTEALGDEKLLIPRMMCNQHQEEPADLEGLIDSDGNHNKQNRHRCKRH